MSIEFFIPIINEKKTNGFTPLINFAETYFNFGTRCYKFIYIKTNGAVVVAEDKLPESQWLHVALKIASMVLSLGIFPLIMLIVKSLYRACHPLQFVKSLSAPSLQEQPIAILHKVFTEFLSPSDLLQQSILNKRFKEMIDNDFMKWESTYKEMTKEIPKKELDLFIKRVKMLYTQNGQEPSFKQKVECLVRELWEEIKQVADTQSVIKEERLTISHLLRKKQYDRFQELIQPFKDKNLIRLAKNGFFEVFMNNKDFTKDKADKDKASLIRAWFNSEASDQTLMTITQFDLENCINLLSTEIINYLMCMSNLEDLLLRRNQLPILPNAIGSLCHLKTLDISINKLSSLPGSFEKLNQLQNLDLSHNKLSTLPIENFIHLEKLYAFRNQITSVELGNFNKLKYIDISDNKLTQLSDNISNLTALKEMRLQNNPLISKDTIQKQLPHTKILF